MITFDKVLPQIREALSEISPDELLAIGPIVINRDLNSRVRLIVSAAIQNDETRLVTIRSIAESILARLQGRTYPPERAVIFQEDIERIKCDAPCLQLNGFDNVFVIDRLATEGNWATIAPETTAAPRVVFFSIKGGVGRSSALAATAWSLAQAGKRTLVLDLDLESPGLSTALLPPERQPTYGITDWLVEDLVDNGDEVLGAMVATSELSHDGEIYVVPAHGAQPGEYVSKLGRVWMSKTNEDGSRENWSKRLRRLISALEKQLTPDVILIDSRAGIDEVASSCVADMGANLVLLFAIEGSQTWMGYRILLDYWKNAGAVNLIRERLQIISALTPETDRISYLEGLRESAYDLFADTLYDEIPPGEPASAKWHFEPSDETAPHHPWEVKWNRSFSGLRSLHGRLATIDDKEIVSIFGPLIEGITDTLGLEKVGD